MGYRFSLKNANAVGHLIEGNVITFLDESSRSLEMLHPNIEFIDGLVTRTHEDFYTSELFWEQLSPDINWLRDTWKEVRGEFENLSNYTIQEHEFLRRSRLLGFLGALSRILSRCKIKTLLLPGFEDSKLNSLMTERYVLHDLVRIHPGDSALILQMKERLSEKKTSILNAFSKFETAYNHIDMWPGVLLWNDEDSLFLKVESERDLFDIYEILRYERGSFNYLRTHFERKQEAKEYAYFFHLSDLHFGDQESNRRKLRLTRILETHLSTLNDKSSAIPIITGDLMDSPCDSNKNTYLEFCELIKSKGFENPIQLLGNHDVDTSGIFKRLSKQKSVISSLSGTNSVVILKDLNLAFVSFNSNTGGNLAQGQIGADQLMNVGNEIDAIPDKEKLTFIALLHHHPKEIENPKWYAKEWYEAFLGSDTFEKTMKLVDANVFLQWIENRGIKLILHGHKHIPKIHKHNDITIVAAGSSTGKVKHVEEGKTFLTYNLIKYDIENKKPVSCSIIAEEILGSGSKNMLLHVL
jgi:hypothetical protein